MDYNKRIDENFLKAEYVDGEVLQHTDMNELESVVKLGVNANYEDIQKIQDGTISVENSNKLSGATLSKVSSETLQNSDVKVPTSAQVKQYIDSAISSIDLTGYASEVFVENKIADTVEIYDSNGNGIVDNAEKVNNHTVNKDVPSDAKFTDTIYDDTEVRGLISDLDDDKVDKVTGKGLSTNDFTNTYKTKLDGIANGAQVNVIEKVKVNGTQQTISSKAVNISVPTQLSQLSDDSTHRLVTDTEKTTWNNKADISDIPSLTNYVKFTDYATAQKGGVIKANMAGFNISTSGIPSANVYNYTNYQNAGTNIFIGKGTLENVITGKNLETADNKVTEITESSTDTEYTSAKAVYDFTNNISEELKEEDEYLNSVIDQLPRDEATGTSATLQPTIQAKIKMSLAPSELEQTTYTGSNKLDSSFETITDANITFSYDSGIITLNNTTASSTGTIILNDTLNDTLSSGTYTCIFQYISGTASGGNSRLSIGDSDVGIATDNEHRYFSFAISSGNTSNMVQTITITENKTINKWGFYVNSGITYTNYKFRLYIVKGTYTTANIPEYEPYVGGTASPNPSYPQDIHTISGNNSVVVCGKNIAYDVNYKSQKNAYYSLVNASYNVTENEYYAISVDTPNTGLSCYINLPTAYGLTRISSNYVEPLDGTRKTWIAKATATKSLINAGLINRSSATSDVETGLLSNFQIEHIASASDTSTSYEPYVSQKVDIDFPCLTNNMININNLLVGYVQSDGTINTNHGNQEMYSPFINVEPNTQYTFKIFESSGSGFNTNNWFGVGEYTTNSVLDFIKRDTMTISTQDYITFTTSATTKYIIVSARWLESATKIMLNQGTTMNYEPYETLEYCKIGNYEDEFMKPSGKNLFDYTKHTALALNNEGMITTTKYYNADDLVTYKLKPNTKYTFSFKNADMELTTNNLSMTINGSWVQTSSGKYSVTTDSNGEFTCKIGASAYSNIGLASLYIQLEEGQATTYEPYGTNQWYLKKNIGKVVLDGTQTISYNGSATTPTNRTTFRFTLPSNALTTDFISDRFIQDSTTSNRYVPVANSDRPYISFDDTILGITSGDTNAQKESKCTAWLTSNNVTIEYPITPTYTPLNDTLQEQLNNMYEKLLSYKGTTNVSQINNDLPFVLGVSALINIENVEEDINSLKIVNETNISLYYDTNINGVAHRGYSTVAPENTLPAYKLARKKGFKYVECDVSFTSDSVAVLLHDSTIDRTSNGTGNINNLTFEQVRTYDFGSWKSSDYIGTQIPSFEEFISLCKNIGLHPYIELKNSATYTEAQIQSLVDIVNKYGMKDKVTWISFTLTYLTYVKNYDSKARLGYVVGAVSSAIITNAQTLQTTDNEVFIDGNYSDLTTETVNLCVNANIPLEVWTVDSQATILSLNSYISGVTSNYLIAGKVLYDNNIE